MRRKYTTVCHMLRAFKLFYDASLSKYFSMFFYQILFSMFLIQNILACFSIKFCLACF
jgi:hypothetical protein